MTLNGAIMQLVELSEHPIMPVIFRPAIQKVIETISELEENPEPPVWYDGEDEIAERNQWKRDIEAIKQLPPIQPKRGQWIDDGSELGCQCSQCGKTLDEYINCGTEYMTLTEIPKFCPNCGADMR